MAEVAFAKDRVLATSSDETDDSQRPLSQRYGLITRVAEKDEGIDKLQAHYGVAKLLSAIRGANFSEKSPLPKKRRK
jgi:hypothetical protein